MAKQRKRRIKWRRIIIAFILLLFIVASISLFAAFKFFELTAKEQNILLLGTDGRITLGDDIRRADTIMLMNADPVTGKVNMVSIPRDTLMPITCTGFEDKINHAYSLAFADAFEDAYEGNSRLTIDELTSYGDTAGIACTKKSIENYFNITIDEVIMVDFSDLIDIIDLIGGIELTSTATFCEMDSSDEVDAFCFEEGNVYNMSGEMALSYARHRSTDNDFSRNLRQQEIMNAVFDQIQNIEYHRLPSLYRFFRNEIYSTFSFRSFVDLVFVKLNQIDLQRIELEGYDYYEDYIYYFIIDDESFQKIVNYFGR